MALIRLILFPFSLLYGLVMLVRNKLFDWGILSSKSFELPIVSVGNLSTGGTGKTPHVEYLIRLLNSSYKLAILSRGYKRKSSGFQLAGESSSVADIGDEPFLFKRKFEKLMVAVDEKRVHGIESLCKQELQPDAIILDDAFQHRYVKPGLSLLLTDYYKLYSKDFVLPSGSLREFRTGAKRANIIIVTKSPKIVSPITRKRISGLLNPLPNQHLFFSYIKHGKLTPLPGINFIPDNQHRFSTILMFAGIANTYPLEMYLKDRCTELNRMIFPDHHPYTVSDIDNLVSRFNDIFTKDKVIITTEKDMVRLQHPEIIEKIKHLPVGYIPIEVKFHKEDKESFDNLILDYVKKNKRNIGVH